MKKAIVLTLMCFGFINVSCETDTKGIDSNSESNKLEVLGDSNLVYVIANQRNRDGGFWGAVGSPGTGCNDKGGTCVIDLRPTPPLTPVPPPTTPTTPGGEGGGLKVEYDKDGKPFVNVDKDAYIEMKFPELALNLDINDLTKFKNVMEFNYKGKLMSWDMDLLEVGTKEKFNSRLENIVSDLTEDNKVGIILIDSKNIERVIR